MPRRLVASLVLAALAAGCTGSAGATYVPFESVPAGPGAAETAGPTGTLLPEPIEATWDTIEDQAEGTLVALTGRVTAGLMVSCFSVGCGLDLHDPAGPVDKARSITVHVIAVSEAGRPNTMVELQGQFSEEDLRLTTDDGTTLRSGDRVRVVGWVGRGDESVWLDCLRLEVASEPEPASTAAAEVVTFRQLGRRAEGTLVKVRGTLSIPWFTFCNERICSITLEDPSSARTAGLYVPAIRGDDERRNGMLPLPSDFSNKDLKVFTDAGKRIGYGATVWVIGTLDNAATEEQRDIEVTAIIAVR